MNSRLRIFRNIVLVPLGVLWIGFGIWNEHNADKKVERSFRKTGLIFSGIVIKAGTSNEHNLGIITLKLLASNRKEYDARDSLDYYYCVIKDSIAEIYDHPCNIGDTIYINAPRLRFYHVAKEGPIDTGSITVSRNYSYYEYIRKNTAFK